MPILVQIRPLVQPGRELKEPKKKGDERNLLRQTGCSPRPPTFTQQYVVLDDGWFSRGSSKFQVSSKSGERFRDVGSNFAVSYCLGQRLISLELLFKFWDPSITFERKKLDTSFLSAGASTKQRTMNDE